MKSVTDLLRAQPPEELDAMADHLTSEIARLQAELEMVNAARSPRRRGRTKATTTSNGNGRAGSLKRDDLYRFVVEQDRPVSPAEMQKIIAAKGYDVRTSAVRTGMSRLVQDKRLTRVSEGLYAKKGYQGGLELESEAPLPPGPIALDS